MYKSIAPVSLRTDNLDSLAKKRIAEIDNIYRCLDELLGLSVPENEQDIPANLIAVQNGYLTYWDGEEWVNIVPLKRGFGVTGENDARPLTSKDIADRPNQINKIGKYERRSGVTALPVSIKGEFGTIHGYPVEIKNLQDGDGLFFKAAIGKWVNASKEFIGIGASLVIRDGAEIHTLFNGDTETNLDLGYTALVNRYKNELANLEVAVDAIDGETESKCNSFLGDLQSDIDYLSDETQKAMDSHNTDGEAHEDLRQAISGWERQLDEMNQQINEVLLFLPVLEDAEVQL